MPWSGFWIATEEQHMKFSWLLSQQEFFLLEKKDNEVEIARGISLHSLLHSVLLELFSLSEYFCYDSLFLQKTWLGWCWVLRLPALILTDLYHCVFLLWWYLSLQRSCFSRKILLGVWRAPGWASNPSWGGSLWSLAGALLACIGDAWEVPDEFWLTQAQWHEGVWKTRIFLDSFPPPCPSFHHKDGLFQWLTSYSDNCQCAGFWSTGICLVIAALEENILYA